MNALKCIEQKHPKLLIRLCSAIFGRLLCLHSAKMTEADIKKNQVETGEKVYASKIQLPTEVLVNITDIIYTKFTYTTTNKKKKKL